MKKKKLLLFPLLIGIVLMVYSWYSSYPLSIDSTSDFVFNHVSVFYWISFVLMLTSMVMIAVTAESYYLKWIMTVSIIFTMSSLSYFYSMMPGSDSNFVRGMTEYLSATKNLNPLLPYKSYLQWPALFLLADTVTSISGLELANVEFLLYTVIGFLMATALYVYASKAFKNGFLAVIAFFIVMFNFLNYQFVPFSLAFGLFLLMLVESRKATSGRAGEIATLVLFAGISIMHAFVPLFFVIFLLIAYIFTRNKRYETLCLLTLFIYLVVQFVLAPTAFGANIWSVMNLSSEYSTIVKLHPVYVPLDATAQGFSTTLTAMGGVLCLAGFVMLLARRKVRNEDKSVLFTGIAYSTVGIFIYTLGSRAFPIVFIPISLGVCYLFKSKFRLFLTCLLVIMLALFVFVPLHLSFYKGDILFQTNEAYKAENSFIDHYNWKNPSFILANFRVVNYLESKTIGNAHFSPDPITIKEVDTIFYTVGLGLHISPSHMDELLYEQRLNLVYNDGPSSVAIRSSNFTWTPAG